MEAPELLLWRTFHFCQRGASLTEIKRWHELTNSYFEAYRPNPTHECHARRALSNIAVAVFAASRTSDAGSLPLLAHVIESFQLLKKLCEPNELSSFQDKELLLRIHAILQQFAIHGKFTGDLNVHLPPYAEASPVRRPRCELLFVLSSLMEGRDDAHVRAFLTLHSFDRFQEELLSFLLTLERRLPETFKEDQLVPPSSTMTAASFTASLPSNFVVPLSQLAAALHVTHPDTTLDALQARWAHLLTPHPANHTPARPFNPVPLSAPVSAHTPFSPARAVPRTATMSHSNSPAASHRHPLAAAAATKVPRTAPPITAEHPESPPLSPTLTPPPAPGMPAPLTPATHTEMDPSAALAITPNAFRRRIGVRPKQSSYYDDDEEKEKGGQSKDDDLQVSHKKETRTPVSTPNGAHKDKDNGKDKAAPHTAPPHRSTPVTTPAPVPARSAAPVAAPAAAASANQMVVRKIAPANAAETARVGEVRSPVLEAPAGSLDLPRIMWPDMTGAELHLFGANVNLSLSPSVQEAVAAIKSSEWCKEAHYGMMIEPRFATNPHIFLSLEKPSVNLALAEKRSVRLEVMVQTPNAGLVFLHGPWYPCELKPVATSDV
eukprot:m.154982 g.154982  ORF g.154982 m.154982 type:complete len:606 (+) comp15138_c10_seq15:1581-3398(+)